MTIRHGYADSRDGTRVFYVHEPGTGTPVLHSLNALNDNASMIARFEEPRAFPRGLAGGAGWIMLDWRGIGRSTKPPHSITFNDLVDDLEAVALTAGGPVDLVGVNDGCAMALALAARHPNVVRRLLLVAPQARLGRVEEFAARAFRRLLAADREAALSAFMTWVHPGIDPRIIVEMAADVVQSVGVTDQIIEAALAEVDLCELASAVTTPSLILYAGFDAENAFELAAALPKSTAVCWTDLGDGTINGQTWREAWDRLVPAARQPAIDRSAARLTAREHEILLLICRGLSNAEIAAELVISPSTAKRHVANVFGKLGVNGRPTAIATAHRLGLTAH